MSIDRLAIGTLAQGGGPRHLEVTQGLRVVFATIPVVGKKCIRGLSRFIAQRLEKGRDVAVDSPSLIE